MRDALISHYEKWKNRYGLSWGQYLRLPPGSKGIRSDIWWHIHFLNRWGDCMARMPHEITSIHYEDMRRNTAPNIECILRHFDIHMSADVIRRAVATASVDAIEQETDPDVPERIVRREEANTAAYFNGEDGKYFRDVIGRNLRHTFGYNYGEAMSVRPKSMTRNRVARNPIA